MFIYFSGNKDLFLKNKITQSPDFEYTTKLEVILNSIQKTVQYSNGPCNSIQLNFYSKEKTQYNKQDFGTTYKLP